MFEDFISRVDIQWKKKT